MPQPTVIAQDMPLNGDDRDRWVRLSGSLIGIEFVKRFKQGQVDHGCDIGTVSTMKLLEELEREAFDIIAYMKELRRRMLNWESTVILDRETLTRLLQMSRDYPVNCEVDESSKKRALELGRSALERSI